MRRKRMRTAFAAALLALVSVSTLSAADVTVGPLVQVSGTSPLAGCTADDAAGQTGTSFGASEVEPWIDVNPINADNMIGVWQQDRWRTAAREGTSPGSR